MRGNSRKFEKLIFTVDLLMIPELKRTNMGF